VVNGIVAVALAYITWWNVGTVYPWARMPAPLALVGTTLWINQRFDMFAPIVPRDSGWFVFPAVLADGTEIDLFRELVSTRHSGTHPVFAARYAGLHRGLIDPGAHGAAGAGGAPPPNDLDEHNRIEVTASSSTSTYYDHNDDDLLHGGDPRGAGASTAASGRDGGRAQGPGSTAKADAARTILDGPVHLGPSLVSWDPPAWPAYEYRSLRWRKYLRAVLRARNAAHRPHLIAYLCRAWNSHPDLGGGGDLYRRVETVRLEFVVATNAKPYRTLPPRRTLFFEGTCEPPAKRTHAKAAGKTKKKRRRAKGNTKKHRTTRK
jgi:hypothetical protein